MRTKIKTRRMDGFWRALFLTRLLMLGAGSCAAPALMAAEQPLYEMQKEAESEVIWTRTTIPANGKVDLADLSGEGVISSLWCTFDVKVREKYNYLGRAIVINMYWDDAEKPAVSVPLADFFGQPLQVQGTDNALFNSSNGWGLFNSLIPMPFRSSARIELVNDSDIRCIFYYQVNVNYKKLSDDALYLHAYWSRQTGVGFRDQFTVLPEVQGQGRYLGTTWGIIQDDVQKRWPWYVRPVKIDFDDKKNSTKPDGSSIEVGTLDDYLGSGWWSSEATPGSYSFPYTGRSYVSVDDQNRLSVVCYRYYIIDPLWFHKKISMQIGPHLSKKIKERSSDWSTTAYFYLNKPENNLPAIQDTTIRTLGF
ncbi:DUF2961 domain-containing protein [Haloferula sp.]|uniref:DUF2961 domain-containing protein n=1 Tax=Haloferula sp. TaxID=2497595 RepID=UPI003C783E44